MILIVHSNLNPIEVKTSKDDLEARAATLLEVLAPLASRETSTKLARVTCTANQPTMVLLVMGINSFHLNSPPLSQERLRRV